MCLVQGLKQITLELQRKEGRVDQAHGSRMLRACSGTLGARALLLTQEEKGA